MKQLGYITNNKTSALIDNGSIVWLPLPKYDSPSVFNKLLDEDGGEFTVKLDESINMYYLHPNVLKTESHDVEIIDLMPKGESGIIRFVETKKTLNITIKPLFNYGLYKPIIEERKRGYRFLNPQGNDCIAVISDKLKRTGYYEFEISPGESYIYLIYSPDSRYGPFNKGSSLTYDFKHAFKKSLNQWKFFFKDKKEKDELDKIYETSIWVLLSSIYSPTGAIVASPTTSLPEVEGGNRNWDYRFAWVRDSSIIAEALIDAGYIVEARRIINFFFGLVNFTSKPFLHPLYTIDGDYPPPEIQINWLSGYKNSKPVRVGNAAAMQIQLDIEGFFLNSVYKYYEATKDKVFIKENWEAIKYIAEWENKNWTLKDVGIWEDRGKPRHYIHSKVMMWVAMDRAERLAKEIGEEVEWDKDKLKEWILQNGVKNGYFVQHTETEDVDASLLTLPLYDFISEKEEIFLNTLREIEKNLVIKDVYVKRYKSDSLGEAKHPFALTTLWLARIYNKLGRNGEQIIRKVFMPPLYLAGEHIDIDRDEYTGNYPQEFVHAEAILAIREIRRNKNRYKTD